MATRSAIGIKHGDVVKAVYCHWDGYLEHNGLILAKFYNDSVKINKLISMGHLSTLGANIGEKQDFNQPDPAETLEDTVCKFYKRDRGEEDVDFKTFESEDDYLTNFDMGVDYYYLFKDNKWYYAYDQGFKELSPNLVMKLLKQAA